MKDVLRKIAARHGDFVTPAPFFTTGKLLRKAEMDGKPRSDWLRRQSPFNWMKGFICKNQKGIEAGWDRHRSATEQVSRRLASTAIETGLWSHAAQTLISNWTAREFRHVTRQDEQVCELCGPHNGQIFSGASNGPPVHPRCRCIAVPVQTG